MRFLLILAILGLNCCNLFKDGTLDDSTPLLLLEEIQLDISEPSGLSIDTEGATLFCVNDPPNNQVHQLDLAGELKSTFSYTGNDLEGVCFDPRDNSVWIIEEGRGQLIHLSASGDFITQTEVDYQLNSNSGLEGVAFNVETQGFLVLKEKNPAVVIQVDSTLLTQASKIIDFASDISGICPGRNQGEFLIISDDDKRLFEWSWDEGISATYSFDIKQAEGVAYDPASGRIYIVCDADAKLYIYDFPND